MQSRYWLDSESWNEIRKFLPQDTKRGPKRKSDYAILSGIIHVFREGIRWQDVPREYGPATTVYNRFRRWSAEPFWEEVVYKLLELGVINRIEIASKMWVKPKKNKPKKS